MVKRYSKKLWFLNIIFTFAYGKGKNAYSEATNKNTIYTIQHYVENLFFRPLLNSVVQ